ncbi:MAG: hypothetical protein WBN75_02965 [Verrucomicrobiia bacterium]|jgi:hypothetical protein
MSPQEISKIIADEIGTNWEHSNWHGCDLRKCLVSPQRKSFSHATDESKTREMWLVFVENPETHAGYRIFFDEEMHQFGLAIEGKDNQDVWLGFYGSFIETFEGM